MYKSLYLTAIAVMTLTTMSGCSTLNTNELKDKRNVLQVPTVMETQSPKDDSTTQKIGRAAATPLTDLNLVREGIPDILKTAQLDPWQGRALDCQSLMDLRQRLAVALGRDIPSKQRDILDKGYDFAEKQAVGAVQRTVEGVVPFRSWVRKLSGAEKHSKEIQSAISAGNTQYAYITGIYHAKNCDANSNTMPSN